MSLGPQPLRLLGCKSFPYLIGVFILKQQLSSNMAPVRPTSKERRVMLFWSQTKWLNRLICFKEKKWQSWHQISIRQRVYMALWGQKTTGSPLEGVYLSCAHFDPLLLSSLVPYAYHYWSTNQNAFYMHIIINQPIRTVFHVHIIIEVLLFWCLLK